MIDWQMLQHHAANLVRLSIGGSDTGAHITRYAMYRRLREVALLWAPPPRLKVLSISHSEALCEILCLPTPEITSLDYPHGNMLELPYESALFHCVVSDQVLEHVAGDPFQAVSETFRVVRPGGLVVHTTCLINPVHGAPLDYWRFTVDALRLLCDGDGIIVEASGWGNPYAWIAIALGLRHQPVPEDVNHPLHQLAVHNDPAWPIVTWVIARKKPLLDNALIGNGKIAFFDAEYPAQVRAGSEFIVRFRLLNECELALSSLYSNPIYLSYHWFDQNGRCVVYDGERTPFPFDIQPGETVTVGVRVLAPPNNGPHRLQISPVQERVCWLHDKLPEAILRLEVSVTGPTTLPVHPQL